MQYQAKDLFQLQSELVEAKVDMAVSHAIDRVLDRIDGLQRDMDTRFTEMDKSMGNRFTSLEKDMVAVKTKLGMADDTQSEIRSRFIEYTFKYASKALGLVIAATAVFVSYFVVHAHLMSWLAKLN